MRWPENKRSQATASSLSAFKGGLALERGGNRQGTPPCGATLSASPLQSLM